MLDDIRYAVRGLARAKGTAAVLVGSLALGTGANAVLYSVMDALLFRAPPGVSDPSRLISVFTSQFSGATYGATSLPDFRSLQQDARVFDALAAFDDTEMDVVRLGDALQRVRTVAVTGEFFSTLGMTPYLGRLLAPGDALVEPRPVVISFASWTAFGRPGDIIGRAVRVGDRTHTVVGVTPPAFDGLRLGHKCDAWLPIDPTDPSRGDRRFAVIGRLDPDADLATAQGLATRVAGRLASENPETNRGTRSNPDEARRFTVTPYSRIDRAARQPIILLSIVVLGATGVLLLSACANAAALLLSRSAARRRERAVKLALGASRAMLGRQALVEGLVVSLAGALLGLLVAYWTATALPARFAPEEGELLDTSIEPAMAIVIAGLACVAGALFAVGPARHATKTLDVEVLRADAGGLSERQGGSRFRAAIVVGQVALSTALLIVSGLLVQALSAALQGELGERSRGVAVVLVEVPGIRSGDVARGIAFTNAALSAARNIQGVEAVAGWVATMPLGRATSQMMQIEAKPGLIETMEVDVNVASADYFRVMRIPVMEGRGFLASDSALAKPVVIVNDVLAARYFGVRAVGARLRDEDGVEFEIVGVVRTGKYRTFQEAPEPMVYFPLSQRHQQYLHLAARVDGGAASLLPAMRASLEAVDRGVDVRLATTFDQFLAQALTLDRLITTVVAASGLAALLLAAIGVYGVIADGVRRRTPEIGLRLALGASGPQILRLVFGEGVPLAAGGVAAGAVAAVVLARAAGTAVHGLPPVDAVSLAVAAVTLLLVVIGASIVPTRRALSVSPTIALRADA